MSRFYKRPHSSEAMQRTFWIEIKKMISDGKNLSYNDIGDVFYKKFTFRISKDSMIKKNVFFISGIASLTKV